jgi:hypothetical protein
MYRVKNFCLLLIFSVLGIGVKTDAVKNEKILQFDIVSVLNARPVTTLTNGKLITWTSGIDGGGKGDGYLTRSAAAFNKQDTTHALPDNALFKANDCHPEIQLHYNTRNSTHHQACSMAGATSVAFFIPKARYDELYFALTSSEGASQLHIELTYADGSNKIKDVELPDYYADLPENSANMCYLVHDLAKWGPANQMTEKDHHNIDLLRVIPDTEKQLESIKISKEKAGYVVFWGATGVKK